MINTSRSYKSAIRNNRAFCIADEVTFADGETADFTMENLMSYSIDEATSESGKFQVGAAIIKEYSVVLDNNSGIYDSYEFEDANIAAKVGLLLPDGTWEMLPKGVYRITQAKENGPTISIKAYDSMLFFDRPYSESSLVYPATVNQIIQDACTCCGVPFDASTVENGSLVVEERPDDEALTFRDIISYAAQMMGCYAKINYQDVLIFGWYSFCNFNVEDSGVFTGKETDYQEDDISDGGDFTETLEDIEDSGEFAEMVEYHHFYDLKSKSINTDDIVITGVKVILEDEEESMTYGEEGYLIVIEGNPLIDSNNIEQVTLYVGEKLTGNQFRPMSITTQSDPSIEAGDSAYITTDWRKSSIPTIITKTTFSIGGLQKVECSAETPTEKKYTKYGAKTRIISKTNKNTERKLSAYDIAVQNMNQLAANTMGFYYTSEQQADGSIIAYRHDKPNLSESKVIYKSGIDGFWISQDGGITWKSGFDSNGNAVLNILSVIGINFSWASGGELKLGGASNGNGALYVYDASGNLIGYWTKDGFYAKTGTFAGNLSGATGTFAGALSAASGTFNGTMSAGVITGSEINGSKFKTETSDGNGSIVIEGATQTFNVKSSEYGSYAGEISPQVIYAERTDGEIELNGEVPAIAIYGKYATAIGIIGETTPALAVMDTNIAIAKDLYGEDQNIFVQGLYASGTKSRVADTDNYGTRTLYCYETPTPYFGDIGSGVLDEDGICYIEIDDIFSETVRTDMEYHVFLQKEGAGDLWVEEKESTYFKIRGTPGLLFSWEIKAIQKAFETLRLDEYGTDPETTEDESEKYYVAEVLSSDGIEAIYEAEIEEYESEMEALYE